MHPKRRTAALFALVAEGFLMRLGFGILSFAVPLYARRLGMNLAETGALLALTGIVKVALKPAAGWLADRIGAKRGLVGALVLRSVVSFLFAFAGVPWQLYSLRTMHGLSTSLRDPAVNALIAETGDEKAMGSAFAWYFTAKSLANALGKAAAGALLAATDSNFTAVFLVTWAISSLALPAVILWVPDPRRSSRLEVVRPPGAADAASAQSPTSSAPPSMRVPRSAIAGKAAGVVGLGFLISVTASMIDRFYPILATEYAHMSPGQAGMVYLASALVALVAGPAFGWLSDSFGRKPTIFLRSAANAGSSLLYLVAPNAAGFTVGKLLDDGGRAGFRPTWGALKADVSSLDRGQRAQWMGVMDVGDDLGDVIGPVGGGLLWQAGGVVGLLVARIALAVLTEVYAARFLWGRVDAPTAGAAAGSETDSAARGASP